MQLVPHFPLRVPRGVPELRERGRPDREEVPAVPRGHRDRREPRNEH